MALPASKPKRTPDDRQSVAAYVATLTADLSALARQQGLHTLGYILDMARLEAETAAREVDP
ncbi:MAG: hypothetical protein AB7P12_18975 [Alphaproteobacteria bacterium]